MPRAELGRAATFRIGEGGPSALLLHGFTGSPAELRYLGERLAQEGLSVLAPCLPGHGEDAGTSAGREDWLGVGRTALEELALRGPVRVVGFSMGALLAVVLAAERPDRIASLALLAPAARLAQPGATVAWALRRFPGLTRAVLSLPKVAGSDLRDPVTRGWNPTGLRVSTHGLAELAALQPRAWDAAPGVYAPARVLIAGRDRTVDGPAACALARRLSGPTEILHFPQSGHVLPLDLERVEVAEAVLELFRR